MKTGSIINVQTDKKEETTWGNFSYSKKISVLKESFEIAIVNLKKAQLNVARKGVELETREESCTDAFKEKVASFKQKTLLTLYKMKSLEARAKSHQGFFVQLEAVKLQSELDEEKADCDKLKKERSDLSREKEVLVERFKMLTRRIELLQEKHSVLFSDEKNEKNENDENDENDEKNEKKVFLKSIKKVIPASMSFKPVGDKSIWKDDKEIQLRAITYEDLLMKLAALVIEHLDPLPLKLKININVLRETLKKDMLAELKIDDASIVEKMLLEAQIDQAVEKEIDDLSKPSSRNPAEAAADANQAPSMRKR